MELITSDKNFNKSVKELSDKIEEYRSLNTEITKRFLGLKPYHTDDELKILDILTTRMHSYGEYDWFISSYHLECIGAKKVSDGTYVIDENEIDEVIVESSGGTYVLKNSDGSKKEIHIDKIGDIVEVIMLYDRPYSYIDSYIRYGVYHGIKVDFDELKSKLEERSKYYLFPN